MNIKEKVSRAQAEGNLDKYVLDLDSKFQFKCRRCGKCCKNQYSVIFNARDIFNIAKKFGKTPLQIVEESAEVYIGESSQLPVVHMLPVGPQKRCPLLLDDGRCSVQDCKPTVCALYPLGRVAIYHDLEGKDAEITKDNISVKYVINEYNCGSAKKTNTVRSWLAQFQIAEEDEFFVLWNQVVGNLSTTMRKLERSDCSVATLNSLWDTIFVWLYVGFDIKKDFMPQFEKAAEKLLDLCRSLRALNLDDSAEETETASEEGDQAQENG